jgi:hypothetical protein
MTNNLELTPEYVVDKTRKYWKVKLDANKTIVLEDGTLYNKHYEKK